MRANTIPIDDATLEIWLFIWIVRKKINSPVIGSTLGCAAKEKGGYCQRSLYFVFQMFLGRENRGFHLATTSQVITIMIHQVGIGRVFIRSEWIIKIYGSNMPAIGFV